MNDSAELMTSAVDHGRRAEPLTVITVSGLGGRRYVASHSRLRIRHCKELGCWFGLQYRMWRSLKQVLLCHGSVLAERFFLQKNKNGSAFIASWAVTRRRDHACGGCLLHGLQQWTARSDDWRPHRYCTIGIEGRDLPNAAVALLTRVAHRGRRLRRGVPGRGSWTSSWPASS